MATDSISNGSVRTDADETLEAQVREAFWKYDPLRMFDDALGITARDGTVLLSGPVRSRSARENAGQLAAKVKGVSGLTNNLVVDSDVEVLVAQALGADPRTQSLFPGVLVGAVFGVVYLKGQAPSAEVKNAATEIARQVPGVAAVSNDLVAPPEPKGTAPAGKGAPKTT